MYECEFRGVAARCKPLDEPKDKKARLDFTRKRVLCPFFPNSLDQWKQDKWLKVKHYTRIKGRKKYEEAKEQLMFMLWHGWQLNWVTGVYTLCDWWQKYQDLWGVQGHTLPRRKWAKKGGKDMGYSSKAKLVTWSQLKRACFKLLNTRLKTERPTDWFFLGLLL